MADDPEMMLKRLGAGLVESMLCDNHQRNIVGLLADIALSLRAIAALLAKLDKEHEEEVRHGR